MQFSSKFFPISAHSMKNAREAQIVRRIHKITFSRSRHFQFGLVLFCSTAFTSNGKHIQSPRGAVHCSLSKRADRCSCGHTTEHTEQSNYVIGVHIHGQNSDDTTFTKLTMKKKTKKTVIFAHSASTSRLRCCVLRATIQMQIIFHECARLPIKLTGEFLLSVVSLRWKNRILVIVGVGPRKTIDYTHLEWRMLREKCCGILFFSVALFFFYLFILFFFWGRYNCAVAMNERKIHWISFVQHRICARASNTVLLWARLNVNCSRWQHPSHRKHDILRIIPLLCLSHRLADGVGWWWWRCTVEFSSAALVQTLRIRPRTDRLEQHFESCSAWHIRRTKLSLRVHVFAGTAHQNERMSEHGESGILVSVDG